MPSNIRQNRNPELVELLSDTYPKRNEVTYEWGRLFALWQTIFALRGLWVANNFNTTGDLIDRTQQARTLTNNGSIEYGRSRFIPYATLVAASVQYFNRADEAGLDITGTETYITSLSRGLSLGCWFYPTAYPGGGTTSGLVSKWDTAGNQRSYRLVMNPSGTVTASVSVDGTATVSQSSTGTASLNNWHWAGMRFNPSSSVAVYLDTEATANTVGIPASIFNSTAPLELGASNAGAALLSARLSMAFLSVADISDAVMRSLYWHGRSFYGA